MGCPTRHSRLHALLAVPPGPLAVRQALEEADALEARHAGILAPGPGSTFWIGFTLCAANACFADLVNLVERGACPVVDVMGDIMAIQLRFCLGSCIRASLWPGLAAALPVGAAPALLRRGPARLPVVETSLAVEVGGLARGGRRPRGAGRLLRTAGQARDDALLRVPLHRVAWTQLLEEADVRQELHVALAPPRPGPTPGLTGALVPAIRSAADILGFVEGHAGPQVHVPRVRLAVGCLAHAQQRSLNARPWPWLQALHAKVLKSIDSGQK
mmetsp:Transcript_36580/g.105375  ORF Transcript_36580/g.105375 Transcript_36580/m.105375 type:complete len:272 (-) Transcript_36580:176-991(-)